VLKVLRPVFAAVFFLVIFAAGTKAQIRFDGYFGMGTAHAGSTHELIDVGTGTYLETPSMDGVFGTFGVGVMFKPSFGVGGEVSMRFRQGDYAGFGYRPIFYDFNGIWTPNLSKRIVPEFQGGLGALNLRYYDPSSYYYDYNTGNYSNFAGSSTHFQLHAAAGLRIFVTDRIFVRPQVDYHWAPHMTEFRGSSIPVYTIAIGFSSESR
jgi:hypothetical protein